MCVKNTSGQKMTANYVDSLLNGDFRLTLGHSDTYYLYGSDKVLLMTLNRSKYGYTPAQYSVNVCGIDSVRHVSQDQEVCQKLYNKVNDLYIKEPMLPIRDGKEYSLIDAKILAGTTEEITTGPGQRRFLDTLITNLVANRCPIKLLERVFYCFDSVKSQEQKKYLPEFHVLGHDNVLCEYWQNNKGLWRFVGDGHVQDFSPMDDNAKQIFDKVKFALQNQRH